MRLRDILGVNPFLLGSHYGGLVWLVYLEPDSSAPKNLLPRVYRNSGVRVADRRAVWFAVKPLHHVLRLDKWLADLRWDCYDWLIRHRFLVGPECGYFHEFRINWPQKWGKHGPL